MSLREIKDLKSTGERSDSEEMREIIKLLESKKRDAVREERFEQAKKYKTGIDQLKEVEFCYNTNHYFYQLIDKLIKCLCIKGSERPR